MYFRYFILFFLLTGFFFFFRTDFNNSFTQKRKILPENLAAKEVQIFFQNKDEKSVITAESIIQEKEQYFLKDLELKNSGQKISATNGVWKENELFLNNGVQGNWQNYEYKSKKASWKLDSQSINFFSNFFLTNPEKKIKLVSQKARLQNNTLEIFDKVLAKLDSTQIQSEKITLQKNKIFSNSPFTLNTKDFILKAEQFLFNEKTNKLQATGDVLLTHQTYKLVAKTISFHLKKNFVFSDDNFLFTDSQEELSIKGGFFLYDFIKKNMMLKENVKIETEEFIFTGKIFLLDLEQQTLISEEKVKIEKRKENLLLSANSFFYDLKNKKLKFE